MGKIKVDGVSKVHKVTVRIARTAGHRQVIGHSLFIASKHYSKFMRLA